MTKSETILAVFAVAWELIAFGWWLIAKSAKRRAELQKQRAEAWKAVAEDWKKSLFTLMVKHEPEALAIYNRMVVDAALERAKEGK